MRRLATVWLIAAILIGAFGVASSTRAQGSQPRITIWTKFNADNPQNAQDTWTKDTIEAYKKDTGNEVENVFQPYDQINSKLNLAVQAGGEVPDLSYVDGQFLGFYANNGTLIDLTDWIKAQAWFKDLTPAAISACTTPDGKIICVPTSTPTSLIYYWKAYYPNGFPATAEDLLTEAARLKKENKYAVTFNGTGVFGLEVSYYSLIKSAGAKINDDKGYAAWANPEMVKVIDYVRSLFAGGYVPQIALAGGFDYENAFKNANAGALLAGSWSYVFGFPVTSPDGKKYDLGADSILAAAKEGKAGFTAPLAFKGGKPAADVYATAWGIPQGSKNVDAAKAFIAYTMQTNVNAAFGVGYGALPSLTSARGADAFKTDYWTTVSDIIDKYGTPMPFLIDYDRGMNALADVFAKCLADPKLDAMKALQDAQDNYNKALQ
ncbi:MAG: extracellular solute-binding protein [Anaerolineae bacterium]|nr:extracellular solute-binding protein [Anaerolineae bacterium]